MADFLIIKDPLTESNCYLIEEAGHALIIDPNQEGKITKILKEHQWILDHVILTHEHCDHMKGLNELREHFKFLVIAQKQCSKNLKNKVKNMSGMMETYLYFKNGGKDLIHYEPFICDPAEIEFDQTYDLWWREHHFKLISIPGHTAGSCSILMDETKLFSGDYLLYDKEDPTIFPGGSKNDYESYVKPWIQSLEDGLHIYPGHGKDYIWHKNAEAI